MNAEQAETLIDAERARQIVIEGCTPEHDDREHSDGSLLRAAVFYHLSGTGMPLSIAEHTGVPVGWPWAAHWWKPDGGLKDLVRAGALCCAEIERQRRARYHPTIAVHRYRRIIEALREFEVPA